MEELFRQIRMSVRSTMDVLILGETGTGKELIAKLVHASGPGARGPFVAVNCAAVPSELLEAELFGVESRIATGVEPRLGLFAQAKDGTLFLDEIGELPLMLQAKLLRVLQEREVRPLGAARPKPFGARVVSATNSDLESKVASGSFRADLYFRLRGLEFRVPALRERREDISALAVHFVDRAAREQEKCVCGLSHSAILYLSQHPWPGNVRELKAAVDRAVLLGAHGGILTSRDFTQTSVQPFRHVDDPCPVRGRSDASGNPEIKPLRLIERDAIVRALAAASGVKTKAAQQLGITRNGLALKMKRLRIPT
jgi:transcriptional regulator with PAS, ATPase and Fis domain